MNLIKSFVCLFQITLCTIAFSQDPTPPSNLSGQDLKDWLKDNWYSPFHSSVGYTSARQQMYSYIDDQNGNVFCVYSGFNQASEFTTFLDPINTEHTVPQSLYNSAEPMRSDIHHLFPVHQNINTARSNLPLNDIPDINTDIWYSGNSNGIFTQNSVPTINIDEFSELKSGTQFEPKEDHKGDAARALFYFFTMYPSQAGDISSVADINTLYQWHLQDPVSITESTRNQRIQQIQGNYNPYVNFPSLVGLAWGLASFTDNCGCPINQSSSMGFAFNGITTSNLDVLINKLDNPFIEVIFPNGFKIKMNDSEYHSEKKYFTNGTKLIVYNSNFYHSFEILNFIN